MLPPVGFQVSVWFGKVRREEDGRWEAYQSRAGRQGRLCSPRRNSAVQQLLTQVGVLLRHRRTAALA